MFCIIIMTALKPRQLFCILHKKVVSICCGHETSPPQAVPLFFQKRAPFCPFGTFPLTGELPFRRGIKPPSLREVADCKVWRREWYGNNACSFRQLASPERRGGTKWRRGRTIGAKRYNHKTLPCLPWKGRWQTEGLTEGFRISTFNF